MGRALAADDLLRLTWLDAPRLAPDGATVAYVAGGLDRDRDAITSRLYRAATDGGPITCLTPDGAADEQPRWSPGGRDRLAFVSDRGGERRLWLADGDGARPVPGAPTGADSPSWSPDSGQLAFVAPDGGEGRALWAVAAGGGQPRRLAGGVGAARGPVWSPDGRRVAFLADRPGEAASDLWLAPADGGRPRRLTVGRGPIRALVWSPDSGRLAYIGHEAGDSPAANFGLRVIGLDGGAPRPLATALDRSIGLPVRADTPSGSSPPDLVWLRIAGRDWLYFLHADRGRSWLARCDLAGRCEIVIGGERAVLAFDAAADRLAFVVADATQPGELRTADLAGGDERGVAAPNADWLGEIALARPEYRPFAADDGATIDSWLLRPPAAREARPALILQIHGGPHYPLGERFYSEFQRLAARGYAVLYANPRGSQGYGEAFAAAIRGTWGDRDARDLSQALDAALADGAGDPARLGLTGVSYGGFMTALLLTRTDRFAAAIGENGIADLAAIYEQNAAARPFWAWEMAGTPATHPARYRDLSPLTHADRIRTPLLLIHAEDDESCPVGQSAVLHAALVARGRAAELRHVPGEGHLMNLVGRPGFRLRRAAWMDEWFDRYLRPAPRAGAGASGERRGRWNGCASGSSAPGGSPRGRTCRA